MNNNKFLAKLSQNLLDILNDEEYYDVTIEVGNNPYYIKIFHAHHRSTYLKEFYQIFLPKIFQIILRYIYGGKISLEEYDTLDIIKILVSGNLMEFNFDLIYKTSFENDSFLELQEFCNNLITKEPNKIFKSLNFSSISEKLLVSLIQSDNLQMNEIQVWKDVLRWGLAQNPKLPSD
ncbi:unnamed protein product [Rhizophagus irregularis]|nr:unnamed protein product [Rhizophagus irregularis]